ncbi:5-formyltetrahydrofolate cyclo-ligase [[Candida] anglica]|uniref:5-formyltetrahydrofolate cyclo-ligase n=1 Tax=[Candida] anglica TaxID=148631 RepID=A0ABP0EDK5_9ASCO
MALGKAALRSALKKELQLVTQDELLRQSMNVRRSLEKVPAFQNAKSVALYMNMPHSEVQTLQMVESSFQTGKKVYLPKCNFKPCVGRKKNYLSMLEVQSYEEVLSFKPQGKYQLLEPVDGKDALEQGNLDLIVVPGVAFTKEGKRLGHGAGFYDEFLSVYFEKFGKLPYLIGVGLKVQLVDELPTEAHDWTLDCVVVENEVYCKRIDSPRHDLE